MVVTPPRSHQSFQGSLAKPADHIVPKLGQRVSVCFGALSIQAVH
jgi:hypothetical protein